MAHVVIDTDILIDFARGDLKASSTLTTLKKNSVLSISAVTQMELIVGCRNKIELTSLQRFLSAFQLLPITNETSEKASSLIAQYNLSHGLLIPDALIAATAICLDEEFITKNQRDYRFISELKLLPY